MSSVEENNKALVRRFLEAQAKGKLNVIDEVLTPHFVDHDRLPGQAPDREGYKRVIAEYQAAFSNVRFLVEDQVAEGEKVVTRFIVRATHDLGELMGVAPTGREVTYKAMAIHRIVGGKIVEEWAEGSNISDVMEQLLEQEMLEHERIEQELRVARTIQQASLPEKVPDLEGWQISPYYQPAREVGGDFYDFHLLSGDQLGLVVGDATGKGVPAALVMSTTCGMLQAVSQTLDSSSPGDVLSRVNETLLPLSTRARMPERKGGRDTLWQQRMRSGRPRSSSTRP
jgi:predicted ester cyclase